MTEEERIVYLEQKMLAEEEMKKKKEDMLAQFLKDKLHKEEKVSKYVKSSFIAYQLLINSNLQSIRAFFGSSLTINVSNKKGDTIQHEPIESSIPDDDEDEQIQGIDERHRNLEPNIRKSRW